MPDPHLHHVGFVVSSIETALPQFALQLGSARTSRIWYDPIQRVRVAFLSPAQHNATKIELVEPAGETSPVAPFLAKGGGLHHVCYEVVALSEHLDEMRRLGARLVRAAQPAVAFEGRRIAWVYTKQKLLIEYLERQ